MTRRSRMRDAARALAENTDPAFWRGLKAVEPKPVNPHAHAGMSMRELFRACRPCGEKRLEWLVRRCVHGTVEEISAARLANDLNPGPYQRFIEAAGYTWKGTTTLRDGAHTAEEN